MTRLLRFTLAVPLLTLLVTGCGTFPDRSRGDGAPRHDINIHAIPDAKPQVEARSRYGNPASYVEFGKRYHVRATSTPFKQHGIASWYGTKFHGRRTSSGEAYDMYAMTAAHKTLPLPTWVEVVNHDNQQRIIVKVNDRGPFINGRIIDLSYAAATRLGVVATGTAKVTITAIDPRQYLMQKNHASETAKRSHSDPHVSPLAAVPDHHVDTDSRTGLDLARLPIASAAVTRPIAVISPAPVTALTTTGQETTPSTQPPRTIGAFYLQVAAFSERRNAEQLQQRLRALEAGKVQIRPNQPQQPSQPTLYRVRIGPLASLSEAGRIAAQITAMGLGEPTIMLD